jgi:flagellar L-ring protein FlgH
MSRIARYLLIFACAGGALLRTAHASDLYTPGSWSALASDRTARSVGDAIVILVVENASASNSATSASRKNRKIDGSIRAGSSLNESGGLGLGGTSDNQGSTGRTGRMVAQISAVVESVLPNGDLRVTGEQNLNINGERTHIRVRGRVRPADISAANAVLSSRLADAAIDYDGSGFVSRSGKPGIITKLFNWLGLL